MKSIKSKPWPAEMRSAIIHAFRPIPPVGRAQRTITCSKILGRFGGLLARGKWRARDIVSADRSPPSVPRGREVCASWNAFPWREMVKKKGKGRETSRREARVKFDARGT